MVKRLIDKHAFDSVKGAITNANNSPHANKPAGLPRSIEELQQKLQVNNVAPAK